MAKIVPIFSIILPATSTVFDPEVESDIQQFDEQLDSKAGQDVDTQQKLSSLIHSQPQLATQIFYERAHTGFTREITVTREDVERLFTEIASAWR